MKLVVNSKYELIVNSKYFQAGWRHSSPRGKRNEIKLGGKGNNSIKIMRKLSKNFHFQKTLATIVGRIRWDLGRMFF